MYTNGYFLHASQKKKSVHLKHEERGQVSHQFQVEKMEFSIDLRFEVI